MASPLHKVPRGLLELFRARTLGKSPDVLSEQVLSTVDATAYYGADMVLCTNNTPVAGVVPNLSNLVVTAGFRVHAVGAVFVNGAAAGANMFLSWGIQVGGNTPTPNTLLQQPYGQIALGNTVAAQAYHGGSAVPTYYAMPGSLIWARVNGTAAGADHQLSVVALIEFAGNN